MKIQLAGSFLSLVVLASLVGACGGTETVAPDLDLGVAPDARTGDGSNGDGSSGDGGLGDANVSNCDEGYRDDGDGCVDIDECEENTDTCDEVVSCTNTDGSFECGDCPAGYGGTGARGCFDINECDFDVCDPLTTCTNTPGDYSCSACPEGHAGSGETSCTLADGCEEDPCDELTTCTPTGVGTYSCSACPSGYVGTGDRGCFDINECDFAACDPRTTCTNTAGGFECGPCPSGYTLDESNTCVDIDECSLGAATCGATEQCVNNEGGYLCGNFRRIAAAESHTCAILDDGTVKCWGDGGDGKLGNGTDRERPEPTRTIALGARAVSIAARSYSTCAVLDDGSVKCWGANWSGQLGDGEVDVSRYAPAFTLPLGAPVRSLALGYEHACALLLDGTVKCWGSNDSGRLGIGSTIPRQPTPTTVDLGAPAVAIASGDAHSCAVLDDGTVWCWGANWNSQLGDGTTDTRREPTAVLDLGENAVDVVTGSNHTCALMESGGLRCWGGNGDGQLGDGTTNDYAGMSVATGALGGTVRAISSGSNHTCVMLADESIRCWGANWDGQLGDGTRDSNSSPGTPHVFAETPLAIGTGYGDTCVLFEGEQIRCWGNNGSGQNGESTLRRRTTPSATTSLGGTATGVAIGVYGSTYAVLSDGTLRTWGYNGNGQLGDGTYTNQTSPTAVSFAASVVNASGGPSHSCVSLSNGTVRCVGYNGNGQLGDGSYNSTPTPVTSGPFGGSNAIWVSTGYNHSCAALANGTVRCWGYNGNGQLGDGSNNSTPTAVATAALGSTATMVAAGPNHSCALLSNGTVWCWGYNGNGQLGDGTYGSRPTPASTAALGASATRIAVGENHSCALLAGGAVSCWGYNGNGQLGDGTYDGRPSPTSVSLGGPAVDVAVGANQSCAAMADGTVQCWGGNWNGQLGDGTLTSRPTPASTATLPGMATRVAVGADHTCALLNGGTVACWGWNGEGRLGLGFDGNYVLAPRPAISIGD